MIICVYNHGTLEFTVTVQNRCVYVQRDPCRFHTRAAVTCQTLSTNTEASLHYAHSHCKIFQSNNIDDMPRYPKTPQDESDHKNRKNCVEKDSVHKNAKNLRNRWCFSDCHVKVDK